MFFVEDVDNEMDEEDSYFDGDGLMDTEFSEEDGVVNTGSNVDIKTETPEFAIANVSCQYDGTPGKFKLYYQRILTHI